MSTRTSKQVLSYSLLSLFFNVSNPGQAHSAYESCYECPKHEVAFEEKYELKRTKWLEAI